MLDGYLGLHDMESHSCDLWILLNFIIFTNHVKIFFCHLDNALINAKFTKFTNLAHYTLLLFLWHIYIILKEHLHPLSQNSKHWDSRADSYWHDCDCYPNHGHTYPKYFWLWCHEEYKVLAGILLCSRK